MNNSNKKRIVIFGAGAAGQTAYEVLCEEYNIVAFSDNDQSKWGSIYLDKPVIEPKVLQEKKDVIVIIASEYYAEINRQLRDMGIDNIKVFMYKASMKHKLNKDAYGLYEIPKEYLFEKCIVDWEKISKIKNNFSLNYDKNVEDTAVDKVLLKKDDNLKKVLFCAYLFPPIGGPGVQRALKFAKYLKRNGYDPIVLTVEPDNYYMFDKDESLLKEVEDITIIRVKNDVNVCEAIPQKEQQEIINLYAAIFDSQEYIESYIKAVSKMTFPLLTPDMTICWVNKCLACIESRVDLNDIDLVYTTAAPFTSFILGYYIKNKYGIPWVQDYRDSWCTNEYYINNIYTASWKQTLIWQEKLEEKLVKKSDAIITIGDEAGEYVDKYGVDRAKFFDIKNGYDEDDFKNISLEIERNEKFTLCHNGEIYINRNPIFLLHSINNLIDSGIVRKEKIQWVFNGAVESHYKAALDKEDKYHVVKYNGYLKHDESIKFAMNSDVLVLYGESGEGAKVMYTGKVFEYLRMKKPILCFASKGVLDELLSETQTGKVFEYDDYEGMEEYLAQLYKKWENGENGINVNESEIQKYSRENETKMLAEVFNSLT